MRPRTEQTRLLIAVVASVLAHALGIVVFAGSYGTLLAQKYTGITTEDDPQEIRLGIEHSEAQTIDWIGYEEYQRHLAPPAEQSQAMMTTGAAQASAPSPPTPEQTPPSASEQAAAAMEGIARTIEDLLLDPLFSSVDDLLKFATNDAAPRPDEAPGSKTTTNADTNTQDASPQKPSPASEDSATVDEREGNANKDTDAVSKETDESVSEYVLGKPLSAKGLDIQTVRPEWSVRTKLMARPRNPRVKIHFTRAGKVKLVVLEASTGEPDVDRPLLDAIYKWRATGAPLEKLAGEDPEATIEITLTIRLR